MKGRKWTTLNPESFSVQMKNTLSWEGGWRLNDGLLLHDFSLSLSNVTGSVSLVLKPRIVSISHHCTKAEECRRGVGRWVDRSDTGRRDQIQERPESAEDQLDLNPRDSEETLDDMKDVKHKQDPREPEAGHRDKIEEGAALKARIFRDFNADEPDDIECLNVGWMGGRMGGVNLLSVEFF